MTDRAGDFMYDHTDRCVERVIQAMYPPKDQIGALMTELAMERNAKRNAMRRLVDVLGENRELRARLRVYETPTPPSEGGEGTTGTSVETDRETSA